MTCAASGTIALVSSRTSDDALSLLRKHRNEHIAELWLDHDLGMLPDGRDHTTMPVVDALLAAAYDDHPYDIGLILLHTSNPVGAARMHQALAQAHYRVRRHAESIWTVG